LLQAHRPSVRAGAAGSCASRSELRIGVDDDGNVVGYTPPGTADLQDHLRDLLRAQVDPLPPSAAITVDVRGSPIGVVRVAESSDTPHIAGDGVIYARAPGRKQRVTDHRDILEMARRGEQARLDAARRQWGLELIKTAMLTPDRIFGDEPGRDAEYPPLLERIVRGSPFTVTGAFADRALSHAATDLAVAQVGSLFPPAQIPPMVPEVRIDPYARGHRATGRQMGTLARRAPQRRSGRGCARVAGPRPRDLRA